MSRETEKQTAITYLDWAATAPLSQSACDAMMPYLTSGRGFVKEQATRTLSMKWDAWLFGRSSRHEKQ